MSTCARAALDLREPLAGTAATARTWLLIENTFQPDENLDVGTEADRA
ncbi:hypothetical protein G6539_08895, partial [Streptomyces albidoflavus]|nr:hypothetical protein [Streptomyces albidoflavus]